MQTRRARPGFAVIVVGFALLLCGSAAPAAAQPEAADYFFPDAPAKSMVYEGDRFWVKPIFAMVGDYTAFSQDDASVAQVGTQDNAREMRAARLGITVRSKGTLGWYFYSTVDYQETRTRQDQVFQLYDLGIGIPLGPVKVFVGKQKEPFAYELVGLSVMLPQQERILLPFFPTRNIGVSFSGHLAADRMTWAAGAFNDWLTDDRKFGRNATDYAGRLTGLAYESPDKTRYLHLALGYRAGGSDDGVMRFSGRPESNVADKYVDTGDFAAHGSNEVSLEGLYAHGRFSVLTEHIGAWVDAPESGNPYFSGYYVAGSWLVTGESRPYNRTGGYAGGLTPKRRFGAVELVGKYSHLNLDGGTLEGGRLDKLHYGINWWASMQWKVGFSYGDADLDRMGLHGDTKMWLTRVQWLY